MPDNTTASSLDMSDLQRYLAEAAPRGRTMLLPALHRAQEIFGWLPREVQIVIGTALRVPLAEIHGVVEFYSMLYNRPTSRQVIRVCEDSACTLAGAEIVAAEIEDRLGLEHGTSSADLTVTYEKVPCLGMCELAPAALNGARPAGELVRSDVGSFLAGEHPEPQAKPYADPAWILSRVGKVDPMSLAAYEQAGGFRILRQIVQSSPEELLDMIEETGILGRGGAMFPLGQKLRFTRQSPLTAEQKHIVINADESEPGTFKDRCLMEEDPYSVVEAAVLAGYAVGAENGWIFVRGEYPRSLQRLTKAVEHARHAGYLGNDILGKAGVNFDIELRLGAGAYICGEETALFEAIEGKRGFPRIKPPFPTTHGLFSQPTAINNVETLVAALTALQVGLDNWKRVGTKDSPGTKLFCLSGHVSKPGLYEVPFGISFGDLIQKAGGVPGGNAIKAVLAGGAAGVIIGPEQLDMPLTYEDSRQKGIPIGSGVVMVFDETVNLRQPLYELSRFFAHESCGKCYPCQLGTQRQMEILDYAAQNGGGQPGDRQRLMDIGFTMTETSLCGLGQTAASAVLSALQRWPELIE